MTLSIEDRRKRLAREHQQQLCVWKREKGPCIICGEREGIEKDHLPPKVLFPRSLQTQETPLFTFPVCPQCNRASSDEDFLFSVLLAIGLNQEAIRNDKDPTDPDLLALYRQAQGHFDDPREALRRANLLKDLVGTDPHSGRPAIKAKEVPLNQTLTKIVKAIYWSHTGGDILQRYNPGWWIVPFVDTSKTHFIEDHLKRSHAEVHWGDRFIYHHTIGHPENGAGGLIMSSLHFYSKRVVGQGMSWMVFASPSKTVVDGRSMYEWASSHWGRATIEPSGERSVSPNSDAAVSPGTDAR